MWNTIFDKAIGQIIREGTLEVTMPDGQKRRYGDGTGERVHIRLKDPDLPRRIVLSPDLGVGEAYMNGQLEVENDDLRAFLTVAIRNSSHRHKLWWQQIVNEVRRTLRRVQQWNPASRARKNVAHHYDLSGELYDLFLDADKQYSCGYFPRPDMTLEEAQEAKKAHIANKLLIEPGMRVLDIGCGWGGMGLTLARDYGAKVLGVTLSEEQHKIACARAKAEGLEDRIEFRLTDYRNVTGTFDRIVSVGMFEHVGAPHYREYFRHVYDKLAPDGVALIHTIGRCGPPGATSPWIAKYIFPGGYIPAMSEMMAAVEKEDLTATDVEVWRIHYAETLKHWHERFAANIDRAREIYDERFCRMWRYYLIACELTFRYSPQVVFQVQLSHDKQAVPLTRDYLYPSGKAAAPAGKANSDKKPVAHAAE
ncbi:SAM-dependent methyltransferase [Tranquillimonas alkanivorans]|uniref:Cyclopropane-fatty-acyl-phospholipid synthase n=1 Tax=Tranquillimonas alkanivorans TaxID=441119 RepID=A0A1I5TB51_9RHOB|nr:cyclopropane-fatty-acyl-phospholipid synthase family protein [Tranquillimonas alkanivorans]SFP80061.1 cyclopropane-fatty-acyl-phospholipid synthase [Tranquillimonas alkanivorans]